MLYPATYRCVRVKILRKKFFVGWGRREGGGSDVGVREESDRENSSSTRNSCFRTIRSIDKLPLPRQHTTTTAASFGCGREMKSSRGFLSLYYTTLLHARGKFVKRKGKGKRRQDTKKTALEKHGRNVKIILHNAARDRWDEKAVGFILEALWHMCNLNDYHLRVSLETILKSSPTLILFCLALFAFASCFIFIYRT